MHRKEISWLKGAGRDSFPWGCWLNWFSPLFWLWPVTWGQVWNCLLVVSCQHSKCFRFWSIWGFGCSVCINISASALKTLSCILSCATGLSFSALVYGHDSPLLMSFQSSFSVFYWWPILPSHSEVHFLLAIASPSLRHVPIPSSFHKFISFTIYRVCVIWRACLQNYWNVCLKWTFYFYYHIF